MRRLRTGLAYAALLFFVCVAGHPGDAAPPLSESDTQAARAAFKAADKNQWKSAQQLAAKASDGLVAKIILWMDLTRNDTSHDFDAIDAFLEENPAWPSLWQLRRQAEAKLPVGKSSDEVLAWFGKFPPRSSEGETRRIAALFAAGRALEAKKAVREIWIEGDFTKQQERVFYRRYRKYLTRDDHSKRLDRLIWDERYWPARRMFSKVDAGTRALAEARLMLMRRMGGVDRAIAKVPQELKNDPGLIYERLRWRRRKGYQDAARELLDRPPADPLRPDKWWIEREYLARRALEDGLISDAYRIASNHGLKPIDGDRPEYADAEWLSGWIALRFLEDKARALDHFLAMYQAVSYPISRARGAYWAGRAAEAMNVPHLSKIWYGTAAKLTTTYYGQLAAARLQPGIELKLPSDPKPTDEELAKFAEQELVRVVRVLHQAGAEKLMRPFISAIADVSPTAGWQAMTAGLAMVAGRPDLAIRVSKEAERDGHSLVKSGYPVIALPDPLGDDGGLLEQALAHAVIRQESAFWHEAISPAGARGLMQLMPATAKRLAKTLNIRYSHDRLTADPQYNLTLGQSYLADMIEQFDGSYVLALAAYNAGPSRASRWIREFGNPRESAVDAIDWVESVPFAETRNYIQRVMENLQVYRARLEKTEVALALEKDLER